MAHEHRHRQFYSHRARKELGEQSAEDSGIAYYGYLPKTSVGEQMVEQALDLLYRRRRILIGSFVAAVAVAATMALSQTPEYEAHSFVMVDLGKESFLKQSNAPIADQDVFAESDRSLAAEVFLLETSRTIAQRVAARLPEEANLTADQLRGTVRFRAVDGGAGEVDALQVTAVSASPERAALLANLYTEEYVRLTQEASRAYLSASRRLLEAQEAEQQNELRQVEEQVEAFLRGQGAIDPLRESSQLSEQIARLEAQRDDARIELQTRQVSLQSLEEELRAVNPQLVQRIASGVERTIQAIQEKVAELEVAREEILLRYPNLEESGAENANLALIDMQIEKLREELERLSQQYVAEVGAAGGMSGGIDVSYLAGLKRQAVQERIGISEAEVRLATIANRIEEYRARLQGLPEQATELAQLQRSRANAERTYQLIVERLEGIRIAEESEPGYAHVIREASVPEEPVRPDMVRYLLIGALMGLFAGGGLAFAYDKMDNRIYKSEQLRSQGHLVLGIIPDMLPLIEEEYNGEAFTTKAGRQVATSMVTWLNPKSAVAEAYRHLRTDIQFSYPEARVQVLLVTSPGMGEGKSVTAANMAIAVARTGRSTLLIDADLRCPRVHQLLGMERGPGMAELLRSPVEEATACIRPWMDNLSVVTAGREVDGVGELLATERLSLLLEELRTRFGMIIIDTPPVRAAADAVLLATKSDAVLMVVRAGKTKEAEFEHSVEKLEGVGGTIVGTVLNGFDVSMAYGHKLRFEHYARYSQYASNGYYEA